MKDNNSSTKNICYYICIQGSIPKRPPISENIEIVVVELEEVLYVQDNSLVVIHCKNINFDIIDVAHYVEGCIYCEEFAINIDSINIVDYLKKRIVPIFWNAEDLAIYIERYYKLKQIRTHGELLQFASRLDCAPHFCNVSHLSNAIAVKLGCDSTVFTPITNAALIHDIGKIALPYSFLNSPRWFNDIERSFVSLHVLYGYSLLDRLNLVDCDSFFVKLCQDVALYHHERYDGSGYPTGKDGKAIPLSVKIVAVADVYDAIRSNRPYRSACDHDIAISFLRANKEKFAPEVVEALEDIMKNVNKKIKNMHLQGGCIESKNMRVKI